MNNTYSGYRISFWEDQPANVRDFFATNEDVVGMMYIGHDVVNAKSEEEAVARVMQPEWRTNHIETVRLGDYGIIGDHLKYGYENAESFICDRDMPLTADQCSQFFFDITGQHPNTKELSAMKPQSHEQYSRDCEILAFDERH